MRIMKVTVKIAPTIYCELATAMWSTELISILQILGPRTN